MPRQAPVAFDADPKTDAGRRTVVTPPHVLPVLAEHMPSWAGEDRTATPAVTCERLTEKTWGDNQSEHNAVVAGWSIR